jgi:hypothetical protein
MYHALDRQKKKKTFQLETPNEGRHFGTLSFKWEGNVKTDLKIALCVGSDFSLRFIKDGKFLG